MSKHLGRDLDALERALLTQSSRVEDMIGKAIRALLERNVNTARKVLENEEVINEFDVYIEEECLKILALHQPVAIDLRRVASVLKINSEIERIGDLSVNICERTISLTKFPTFEIPFKLERMSEIAIAMVREALDAFLKFNTSAAQDVCQRDDEVDDYNRDVINELKELMKNDPSLIDPALYCFSISRNLERIADYATNIAEDVIYLVDGEIARHRASDFDGV